MPLLANILDGKTPPIHKRVICNIITKYLPHINLPKRPTDGNRRSKEDKNKQNEKKKFLKIYKYHIYTTQRDLAWAVMYK